MKNNIYVDIHVLQNVPPSCINRDDTGSPKTAKYGGVVRARVSSQAWKHEMRKMFRELRSEEEVGIRTKKVPQMIADAVKEMDNGIEDEKAMKLALNALGNAGIKTDKEGLSPVLIFFSAAQAKAVAHLAIRESKDKKEYQNALKTAPSMDMALFGRMVAADPSLNFDAAAQVAHAISTHAVHNEYDYFTAVDDLAQDEEAGAGHLGTVEFNSATLYRYATVNIVELQKNLGAQAGEAVKCFAEAFMKAMPTGKQNTFANRTLPDFVYIVLRTDQPVNLAGAFEKPVSGVNGYLEESETRFREYAGTIYRKFACAPEKVWEFGEMDILQILEGVKSAVEEKMSESRGE
ncbi:MAG: type I-E CRISPR-associated protein Cas7/Cse4/CasC [Lachnospiraceae bacterium]|jgi:CRISPR system Cascade subunit CasC|nr:type I-E CRISPR-associated protein Cas7/Cse4/CasC [Lachnospiraceae bacterium]